ncbi:hypothetical protein ABIA24_002110 [Sinorhizobium fredii]
MNDRNHTRRGTANTMWSFQVSTERNGFTVTYGVNWVTFCIGLLCKRIAGSRKGTLCPTMCIC